MNVIYLNKYTKEKIIISVYTLKCARILVFGAFFLFKLIITPRYEGRVCRRQIDLPYSCTSLEKVTTLLNIFYGSYLWNTYPSLMWSNFQAFYLWFSVRYLSAFSFFLKSLCLNSTTNIKCYCDLSYAIRLKLTYLMLTGTVTTNMS